MFVPDIIYGIELEANGIWRGTTPCVDPSLAEAATGEAAGAEAIGRAFRHALRASSVTTDFQEAHRFSGDFNACLASRFGLTSSKALYPGMRLVFAEWELDTISLTPTRRRRGGFFEGFPVGYEHFDVVTQFSRSDEELGEAVGTCLRRCTT